ncbi:MAG: UDP-N-acetylmuramoyl-tripeptide--D-alanyl-D-alanine ligase [bacterium]|nr:UDP-N-acetylmuramoyl-tripeptide--D-alanyl-D-alanine ligase [bacterium]
MKKIFRTIIVWLLTLEARLVLKKYKPRIVGVTGSVGKTNIKEAVATVLAAKYTVYRSTKSYNSEFGVPLSILQCQSGWNNPFSWLKILLEGLGLILFPNTYPEWLVLELGVDRPGDMRALMNWVKLDVAVLGRVGDLPGHVEFFDSPKDVLNEKALILDGLKQGGVFIRLADDPAISHISRGDITTITFGYHRDADVRATYERIAYSTGKGQKYPTGFSLKAQYKGESYLIKLTDVFGAGVTYAVLAACAVASSQGIDGNEVAAALATFKGMPGRLRIIQGNKNTVIIDDTYNSSPASCALAMGHLEQIKHVKRKIVVLGDMLELGQYTIEAHREVGAHAATFADMIYVVGSRMKFAQEEAISKGYNKENIAWFVRSQEAGRALEQDLVEGDVVLVKGSQGMRMEYVVEEIMAEPERAAELLVRQDLVWKKRT